MPLKKNLTLAAVAVTVSLATPSPNLTMLSNKDNLKNIEIKTLKAKIKALKGKAVAPLPNIATLN